MKCVVVFTNRGVGRLLEEGGSQAWKLDPERVRKLTYVVCVQNRNDGDWGRPTHDQSAGFLIGKISTVELSPEKEPEERRYIIKFSEYAEISIPRFWERLGGLRNPVHYLNNLEDYLDVSTLEWLPVRPQTDGEPPRAASLPAPGSNNRGLDITEAKKALALFYRVPVTAIEIVIRG